MTWHYLRCWWQARRIRRRLEGLGVVLAHRQARPDR